MWHYTHDTWQMTGGRRWTFSPNFSSLALKACELEVTFDTGHVTPDMWHMTCDMWHVSRGTYGVVNIVSKFQPVRWCNLIMTTWPPEFLHCGGGGVGPNPKLLRHFFDKNLGTLNFFLLQILTYFERGEGGLTPIQNFWGTFVFKLWH